MNIVTSSLYRGSEWIMRFAWVQLLWLGSSLLGMILLGFFPSTIAMFTVIRKWIMGQSDIPILKTFWDTFKAEWLKSNLFGLLLSFIGILIYVDLTLVNHSTEPFMQWSKYPMLLLVITFSLILLYAFPSYVHYNVNLLNVLKNSLFIMLVSPFYNVVMILGLVVIFLIGNILPPLFVFFGGSAIAFVIMWACYQSFLSIERKKAKLKNFSNEP
ncbi:YesL family protein [Mesobacillus maritimus]|uniref:YesL family protein n=1 Tax=Mesobacillus maritimus TaxID=1643336 RepID=UPI00384E3FCC